MRRADRLFRIVQRLRRRGATTAAQLAELLEVSERTIYRDVRDLTLSGVPIRGEAGVGYALPQDFDLPPLMFDADEIESLVLGCRIVQSWADPGLARAAESILGKVEAVLPQRLKARVADTALFALNFGQDSGGKALPVLRAAIREHRKVSFTYSDEREAPSSRAVRPLALFYWRASWSLGAWCELRADFRNFRLDRVSELRTLDATFTPEPGRGLADFLERKRRDNAGR